MGIGHGASGMGHRAWGIGRSEAEGWASVASVASGGILTTLENRYIGEGEGKRKTP